MFVLYLFLWGFWIIFKTDQRHGEFNVSKSEVIISKILEVILQDVNKNDVNMTNMDGNETAFKKNCF